MRADFADLYSSRFSDRGCAEMTDCPWHPVHEIGRFHSFAKASERATLQTSQYIEMIHNRCSRKSRISLERVTFNQEELFFYLWSSHFGMAQNCLDTLKPSVTFRKGHSVLLLCLTAINPFLVGDGCSRQKCRLHV